MLADARVVLIFWRAYLSMKRRFLTSIGLLAFLSSSYSFGLWATAAIREGEVASKDFFASGAYRPDRIIPDHQFPLQHDTGDLWKVSALLGIMLQSPLARPVSPADIVVVTH